MSKKKKYYRNWAMVLSDQGVEIDPGSLWKFSKDENLMILVDEDDYQTKKPSDLFEKES